MRAARLAWAASLALLAGAFGVALRDGAASARAGSVRLMDPERALAEARSPGRAIVNADYYAALSQRLADLAPDDDGALRALTLAELARDPDRPYPLARLAWLDARAHGPGSDQHLAALRRAVAACPLCDRRLLKWRLEHVLAHWDAMPEDLRAAAFEGGDLLRWWHVEYDYLAALRTQALAAGVDWDGYALAVGTPVRPWEVTEAAASAGP
jgi:hypothetical protein